MSRYASERDDSQPLVTIAMPCYNNGSALLESVASAQAQTYPEIELVIVDDGSTDSETLSALAECESTGIKVLRQPNGGVSNALNTAIRAGHGKYFMPLADDLIDPPYVAEAVDIMQTTASAGIVYSNARLFGSIDGPWTLPPFSMKRQLTDNCIFATPLFRIEDWRVAGGYDEQMRRGREDHDFIMRILSLGRSVHRLDGEYFHYRQGNTKSVNAKVGQSRQDLIQAHAQILRNNTDLYATHADLFWESYFELVDERNDLRNRYRVLEQLRQSAIVTKVRTKLSHAPAGLSALKGRRAR